MLGGAESSRLLLTRVFTLFHFRQRYVSVWGSISTLWQRGKYQLDWKEGERREGGGERVEKRGREERERRERERERREAQLSNRMTRKQLTNPGTFSLIHFMEESHCLQQYNSTSTVACHTLFLLKSFIRGRVYGLSLYSYSSLNGGWPGENGSCSYECSKAHDSRFLYLPTLACRTVWHDLW